MQAMSESRRVWRSVGAVVAGALVGIVLSTATDFLLHALRVVPDVAHLWSNPQLLLATAYRTVYSVLGSYLCARLAPFQPMKHSLVLGFLGLGASLSGALLTWNRNLGPHWYPVALILLALPTAWAGARIRIAQMRTSVAAV
jgi:hypothetical protein